MPLYDNDTDPFNDGSLLESYLFDDSLSNEQNTRTLIATQEGEGEDFEGYWFDYGVLGNAREVGSLYSDTCPLSGQMDCTVSLWANVDTPGNFVSATIGDTSEGKGISVGVYRESETEVFINGEVAENTSLTSVTTIDSSKEWFFLTMTYNVSTGDATLYLDGANIKSGVEVGAEFATSTPISVSGDTYGIVDQLMIWNKELSLSEVNSLYTMEKRIDFIDLLVVSDSTTISTIDFNIVSSAASLNFIDFNISSEDSIPDFIDFEIASIAHRGVVIDFDITSTSTKDPEFINLNIISGNIPSDTESPSHYSAQLIRRVL